MKVKMGAFPVVYFHSVCTKHECALELRIDGARPHDFDLPIGGEIIAIACKKGGSGSTAECTDSWELNVHATGEVRVSL